MTAVAHRLPQLSRTLVTLLATSKYRMRLPGFELPEPVIIAQRELDDDLAGALETVADRIEGKSTPQPPSLERRVAALEQAIDVTESPASQEA